MDNKETIKKKEHYGAGIFGAFLFALLYAVLWVVLFIFWREDVCHWSAFLLTWFSCVGYSFLSAAKRSKLSIVFGTIFGGLFTVAAHVASYFIKLLISTYEYTDILTLIDNIKAFSSEFQMALLTRGYYARFSQQMYIALVMAVIGVVLFCYSTFWSKKAQKEKSGIERTILTEIWSDAPKKQDDIPASPDWIWKNSTAGQTPKKAPETLVKNDISSSLLGDDEDDSASSTGFTPKKNTDNA